MTALRSSGYRAMATLGRGALRLGLAKGGLRVLGYHDVPDADTLETQLVWLQRHWNVLPFDQAIERASMAAEADRSVLVTFDDGDSSVIERGLPVLDSLGISAVMFVCPGVVDTRLPFWWQVVEAAGKRGVDLDGRPIDGSTVSRLKTLADAKRRDLVGRLLSEPRMADYEIRQVTTAELERWVASGHHVGNHTWDHPLLDTCEPADQIMQVQRAHAWLVERGLLTRPVFAYPNGNWTEQTDSVLSELGYCGAMLFDHRVHYGSDPLKVSRLRVNADDSPDVFVAKVSGLHSAFHRITGRS